MMDFRNNILSSTTLKTPHLPNELLLDILLHVAQEHPYSLPTLYRVNRHWFNLIKRYEPLLWKTATLAAFPDVTLPDPEGDESRQWQQDSAARWKRVYGIHLGWRTRKAQVLLVQPQRPEARSAPSATLMAPMMAAAAVAQQEHGHIHDHHQLGLLEYHGQQHHAAVVSNDRDLGHAFSSSLMSHEPPMVIHSSVSTSPCVLMMDETVASHDTHNINSYTGSSNSSSGEGMGASHPFSVLPQLQQQQQHQQQHQQDTLSCSLCTYADLCLVPQLQICVRIHRDRNQPLMQVLDWSLQHVVEMEGALNDCHQDLISGTAVNERGTMMASCSIDGTVRVWDLNQAFRVVAGGGGDHHRLHQGSTTGVSFVDKVKRFGCPIKSRWLLTGHVGWVNAVAIEDTTVVSGGSDHTVRVWDALTGTLKYLIPDLYTSRPELGLGVYAVAIHGSSVIGSGSVMEGYQLHDLSTGELLFELDEPLSSRDHVRFETELYQQYASRIAITDTVVVTNSKMEGMLCVWSRQTGELMYRIHVCEAAAAPVPGPHAGPDQEKGGRLVTFEASGPGSRIRREGVAAAAAAAGQHEDEETVHTFKINKSGSMLMCTLCDGRASLIEFGSASERCRLPGRNWVVEATGHGSLMAQTEPQGEEQQQQQQQQQLQEHYHHCGALAWAWTCTGQGSNRVVLV